MEIFQMHSDHGRHVAYDANEAKANTAAGWVTVTKDEFYAEIRDKQKPVELSREDLIELYVLKFDKKPAFNMKTENIKAKLDE